MELKICHLYPDVLNLYGDRGNIICMEHRLRSRGIDVVTTGISIGERLDAASYDLIFVGGGQGFEQDVLMSDLQGEKTQMIKAAVEDGITMLAICAGYQMLGHYYEGFDGTRIEFTGALDVYTVDSKPRMIGDYMYYCEEIGQEVVGFENHAGKTYLGSGVKPMGKVLSGSGNNGEDQTEGARYHNVFGTYAHGCLLPKNPVLCDHILKTALARKYGSVQLQPLNDELEHAAHDYMVRRLTK